MPYRFVMHEMLYKVYLTHDFLKNLCMKWNQDNHPLHPPFPFVLVNRKFVLHLGDSGTTQESWVIESLGESYHKY